MEVSSPQCEDLSIGHSAIRTRLYERATYLQQLRHNARPFILGSYSWSLVPYQSASGSALPVSPSAQAGFSSSRAPSVTSWLSYSPVSALLTLLPPKPPAEAVLALRRCQIGKTTKFVKSSLRVSFPCLHSGHRLSVVNHRNAHSRQKMWPQYVSTGQVYSWWQTAHLFSVSVLYLRSARLLPLSALALRTSRSISLVRRGAVLPRVRASLLCSASVGGLKMMVELEGGGGMRPIERMTLHGRIRG